MSSASYLQQLIILALSSKCVSVVLMAQERLLHCLNWWNIGYPRRLHVVHHTSLGEWLLASGSVGQRLGKKSYCMQERMLDFKVMPFGLCNAPTTFQYLKEPVLAGAKSSTCLVYLDDIVIVRKSFHEHLANVRDVLNKLRQTGLHTYIWTIQFNTLLHHIIHSQTTSRAIYSNHDWYVGHYSWWSLTQGSGSAIWAHSAWHTIPVHISFTDFMPLYLMLVQRAKLPIDTDYNNPSLESDSIGQYVTDIRKSFEDAYQNVVTQRQTELYDWKAYGLADWPIHGGQAPLRRT